MSEEWIKRYRVFPRFFALFYLYYMSKVIDWAMAQPDPTQAEILVGAVTVPAAAFFKFYVETGNDAK